MISSYCEVLNYLLATYATDKFIAEANMDIINFKQCADKNADEHAQALWTKGLRCRLVYDEYGLKGIFTEGLRQSLSQNH